MRSRSLAAYTGVTGVLIGAFALAPDVNWVRVVWQLVIGWGVAAVTVLGVRRYRPPAGAAWLFFAAGVFLNSSGILVEAIVYRLEPEGTYPTMADAFWLALYPCVFAGMIVIQRASGRRGDVAVTLDSATITTGLGLLSWVFVIGPTTHDDTLTLLGHVVVAAYPVGDIMILALMTRLLLGGGWRNPALRCLIGALVTLLLGDLLWVVWSQLGVEPTGIGLNLMNVIFLAAFALVGASVLHPSVREVAAPPTGQDSRLSPMLLVALTLAALIAPALLLLQALTGGIVDGVSIAISSTVLFLLVVTRLAGLLRRIDAQAAQLRALARVDALTGLMNRRAWDGELPVALERARRDGASLSVVMLDLDHFKKFNDEFGHPAGDRLLKGAAAAWMDAIRAVDVLGRYGGEEFILLLPGVSVADGQALVERLRSVTPLGQTFSAGLAQWDGAETSDELVSRADKALYAAKNAGRNRTAVAPVPVGSGR